jgi:hypothetical protein
MDITEKPLEELVKVLPPSLRAEVRDFVEFLLAKHGRRAPGKLRQDWAGTLGAYRAQETAVDLQHKALDWRAG